MDDTVDKINCTVFKVKDDGSKVASPREGVEHNPALLTCRLLTDNNLDVDQEHVREQSDSSKSPEPLLEEQESTGDKQVNFLVEVNVNDNHGTEEMEVDDETEKVASVDRNNGASAVARTENVGEIVPEKIVEITHDNSEKGSKQVDEKAFRSSRYGIPPGWMYHGENGGYRYYVGCAGEFYSLHSVLSGRLVMRFFNYGSRVKSNVYRQTQSSFAIYSIDRDGYWYMQDSGGNFIPYTNYNYNRGMRSSLFPHDMKGRFILPTNARGEKAFPVDINNMPIFPFDPITHLPTFPVDDNGQPVFPTGVLGRPIVPVDTNGLAIFPRDANNRFIFPSGPNGKPIAPVNIYGVPVMPLDEHGKPVVPYDASGKPLIHLASDGITPLTEEEYQYSLQWNDYFSRYYKGGMEQKSNASHQTLTQSTVSSTYEQSARHMKMLKKVRPEDIDLPPTVPPPPTTYPPQSLNIPILPCEDIEKKTTSDPALRAKTKKMIEMQLKFSRKKLRDNTQTSILYASAEDTPTDALSVSLQADGIQKDVDKSESQEFSPPLPTATLPSDSPLSVEPEHNLRTEASNIDLFADEKHLGDYLNAQKVAGDITTNSEMKQAATEQIKLLPNALTNDINASYGMMNSENQNQVFVALPKEYGGDLCGDSKTEKGIAESSSEWLSESKVMNFGSGVVPVSSSTDVISETYVLEKNVEAAESFEDNASGHKLGTKPSDEEIFESKNEKEASQKREDFSEHSSRSHGKSVGKKSHRDKPKQRVKQRSDSEHRHSLHHRVSHRRSRSGEKRHRSPARSRTPHDYYCHTRHYSRNRDRLRKHSSRSRRSYRRYWTPDVDDKYASENQRSSSREKSSEYGRSTSREKTPTPEKSSRSCSYYEDSKSRSSSIVNMQHSIRSRIPSSYRTSDNRNRSSSRHTSTGLIKTF
ncbi:unnamed protein product [Thelazia callipaeda]|uniref:Trithorax group protein osa n=1 Tax=Thelazia callipaeda TaxID=103827 RepID=A0A158RAW0_THECL|nr:unnamed protein product [Thelazia callipaeda]